MKSRYIFGLIFCVAALFSCKDGAEYHDALFITGTDLSTSRMFAVDVAPSEIAFSVSASNKASEKIDITVQPNPGLVSKYNKENRKNYQLLEAGTYQLSSNETSIEVDQFTSKPVKLVVTDVSKFKEGVTYLLPVSITKAKGNMEVLEASQTIYFVINKTIITQAASLVGNYFSVNFAKNEDATLKALPALTYETRIYVNAFAASSPYISSVMGLEENYLLRFGDVSIKPNQIQITGGGQTSTTEFAVRKWYHVAVVFEGGTNKLYIDGKLEASGSAKTNAIDLTFVYSDPMFMIGRSAKGRGLNGAISECRVWTKALSQADLVNNMCYVDPTTPGLLAYWRFNGADGKVVTDMTGHGYDATANVEVKWVEGIRCPE